MSQQSIADKAQVIRTETQKYGNTRQRVADVLDDINTTKANNDDLSSLSSSVQANTTAIDSINQNLTNISIEQVQQNTNISYKLDKPNSDGSYYITKSTVAGTSYYHYRAINLSSGQIPVSRDTYIGASLLYESVSGRIGLDTQAPSEKFEVYNGRVKADGFMLTSSIVAPLPREIKFKGGNFVGAKDDGIECKFLMEGGLDMELTTKLDKGTYAGTAQDLKNDIETKQKKLSSFDESILIEPDGNIEGNVSLFIEYFNQQVCELNFTPIQIIGIYVNGIKQRPSSYVITLPKTITIINFTSGDYIEIQYTKLKI